MSIQSEAQIRLLITDNTFSYLQAAFKRFAENTIVRLIFWIGVKVVIIQMIMHIVTYMQVNDQLGFNYATPWVNGKEVFVISELVAGEAMFAAGFQVGDHILYRSVDRLYYTLIAHQENVACIPIDRDGQQMFICLWVPPLKLTFPPEIMYWLPEK